MNKRGELTSKEIIGIVILIISFVIILIFFFIFNPKNEVTKDSCRNSVLLRANEFGKSVKLQCSTQEVCISAGGDCKTAAKNVEKIKVANQNEFYDALSNLISECWWMMGEGKVDYAPKGFGFQESYCNLCNTIRFDDKFRADNNLNKLDMKQFYTYLENKPASNGNSMLNYLYGVNSLDSVQQSILSSTTPPVDIYKANIDLAEDKEYGVVTGMTHEGWGPAIVGYGVGTAVGLAVLGLTGGTGAPATASTVTMVATGIKAVFTVLGTSKTYGAAGVGVGLYVASGNQKYLPPQLYAMDADVINGLQCKEFTSQAA